LDNGVLQAVDAGSSISQWARIKPGTPNIQPSTCATTRSGGVRSGFRKTARLPSRSARDSQAAMLKASRWSAGRVRLRETC